VIWSLDGEAPEIHPTAWVAPSAQVIGRVRLGPHASVWYGAVLRGDNEWLEVGEESNVQDNAVLHADWGFPLTVGARCTVGHRAILHGCTLGEAVLVGMGATVLNGATLGPECLVGAAALVTEGRSVPPRSLVLGAPARVARPLDDAEAARLHASARAYVETARRHAGGLRTACGPER
jgi:carbonic anhydrase/acetyltransferase-like protein (isoleucine patch superfamily)